MKAHIYGNVVERDGVGPGLITIEDGRIVALRRSPSHEDLARIQGTVSRYDLEKYVIFPGFVDIHTHCRQDVTGKDCHKEDYATVGLAALNGGVTFIADMPNNPIVPLSKRPYDLKQHLAKVKCPIDVLCYAGIGPGSMPFTGCYTTEVPYKVFLGPSTRSNDELHFNDYEEVEQTLANYRGKAISFHCEDPKLLAAYSNRSTHEQRRPDICEIMAVNAALGFIEDYNLAGKVCHVSTLASYEGIMARRKHSTCDVSMEVTPHHLFFDVDMITPENKLFLQMNPPLRQRDQRLGLLEFVRQGKFDYLASDHAPHTTTEKLAGISGVPQLDTYGAFVTWLIKEAKVPLRVVWAMACANPGEWIGTFTGRKVGRIEADYEASITVLNLDKPMIDSRQLYTKCKWSPFDLRSLPGSVEAVWLRGERVVDGLYMKDFSARGE